MGSPTVKNALTIDARVLGGGPRANKLLDVVKEHPALQYNSTDLGGPDTGIPYSGHFSNVVRIPYTLLTQYGGVLTMDQITERLYRHAASGTYLIIELGGVIPRIVYAEPGYNKGTINVVWSIESPLYTYNVYVADNWKGPWTEAGGNKDNTSPIVLDAYYDLGENSPEYLISDLVPGKVYYVAVTAVNTSSGIESPPSVVWEVQASKGYGIPACVTAMSTDGGEIIVSWGCDALSSGPAIVSAINPSSAILGTMNATTENAVASDTSVPVSAASSSILATGESQGKVLDLATYAYSLGYEHIFPFDAFHGEGVDIGTAPNGDMTLGGSAAWAAATANGSRGRLVTTTNTTDHSIFDTSGGDWQRNGDRTWILAFTITDWLADHSIWAPSGDITSINHNQYYCVLGNVDSSSLRLSYYDGGWAHAMTLTGTNSLIEGRKVLVAISYNYAEARFQGYWRYDSSSRFSGIGAMPVGISTSTSHRLGSNHTNTNTMPFDAHFFAVGSSLITSTQFDNFDSLLGLNAEMPI